MPHCATCRWRSRRSPPAKPGQPGHVSAVRKSEANALAGDVEIRCEAGRVDIEANQRGDLLGDKQFERGVFLGVTGRAGLEVVREGRDATGEVRRRSADASATNAGAPPVPASATAAPPDVEPAPVGTSLDVQMEALRGFASVLDFDADLSAGGVLPVRVSMRNSTRRSYDFDPSTLVLNVAGERTRVSPLTPADAYSRLAAESRSVTRRHRSREGPARREGDHWWPPCTRRHPRGIRLLSSRQLRPCTLVGYRHRDR